MHNEMMPKFKWHSWPGIILIASLFSHVYFSFFFSAIDIRTLFPPVWMVIFDEWSEHERAFNQNSISITSEPCDVSWHWMKHPFAVFFLPIRTENWFAGNGLPFNWCILWKCSRLCVMCIIRCEKAIVFANNTNHFHMVAAQKHFWQL